MGKMKSITIVEDDRVGLVLDISYILAKERINIESISVVTIGGKAIIVLTTDDNKRAKEVLEKNGFNVVEKEMITVRLKDRPGELAKVSKILADEGISILEMQILAREEGDTAVVGMVVDKPRKARLLLQDYIV